MREKDYKKYEKVPKIFFGIPWSYVNFIRHLRSLNLNKINRCNLSQAVYRGPGRYSGINYHEIWIRETENRNKKSKGIESQEKVCLNLALQSHNNLLGEYGLDFDVARAMGFNRSRAINQFVNKEGEIVLDDFRCDAERVDVDKNGIVRKSNPPKYTKS